MSSKMRGLRASSEAAMLDKLSNETTKNSANRKRDKFIDLAEGRTKNAIRAIKTIAKLGNKNAYDYTENDVKKITNALSREVDALKTRMLSTGGKESVDFKL